jgi:hypothetical protein
VYSRQTNQSARTVEKCIEAARLVAVQPVEVP